MLAAIEEPPITSIRINKHKWNQPVPLQNIPWNPQGFWLPRRPFFTGDPLFHAGAYYVQEASSMILGSIVAQLKLMTHEPIRVLDLCGAPGGKSTDVLNQLQSEDLLVTNEVIRARSSILSENITKWGTPNVVVTNNDPADFNKLGGFFDLMLIDAPCSGEGLFRKDPRAIDEWSEEGVMHCSARQKRIIADAWESLREGGFLIYSTCTYNLHENEEVLEWLNSNADVSSVTLKIPSHYHISERNGIKLYKALPHRMQGEGFSFFAVRKEQKTTTSKIKKIRKVSRSKWNIPGLDGALYQEGEHIYKWCTEHEQDVFLLNSMLKCMKKGVHVGVEKKNKWVPSHELAMFANTPTPFSRVDIDGVQAIKFLRKEPFELEMQGKGYFLVVYRGIALGWINYLGNRFNNLYPTNWRIMTSKLIEKPTEVLV